SPLRSGYGSLSDLYAFYQFRPNLERYSRWLLQTQTPLVLLFAAAPYVVSERRISRAGVWLVTLIFPLAVLALYLLYNPFEEWWYLRFLLPGFPPMLAALAAVIIGACREVARRMGVAGSRAPAAIAALALGAIGVGSVLFARGADVLGLAPAEQRYPLVAQYTKQLPARAVFVGVNHTGAL